MLIARRERLAVAAAIGCALVVSSTRAAANGQGSPQTAGVAHAIRSSGSSAMITEAFLGADKNAPVPVGTAVNLFADASEGVPPYSFKFFITADGWAHSTVLR